MIQMNRSGLSLKALSHSINRPSITFAAIAIALALGAMQFPFLQYLRPIGDFYIALLKICVLPFLLSTIPLAVRSAMSSGSAGGTLRSLVIWIAIAMAAVALVTVGVTSAIFHYASVDEQMIAKIGALVGQSADGIDVEFAINPSHDPQSTGSGETGIFSVIPTNIFAALSSNDSVRVLIFALIFGIGMVMTERQSGHSIFGALRHVQAVCITIFDWFSLLVPLGIVALIAPQVASRCPHGPCAIWLRISCNEPTPVVVRHISLCAVPSCVPDRSICCLTEAYDAWRIDAQHADLHSHCVRSVEGRSKDKTRDM